MTNPTHPEVEAHAQRIQDYFFARGAALSKQDWNWLVATLTEQHAKHEAEKAAIVAEIQNRTSMSFLPMVQNESKFGTTEMHSNTVRFGYNLALSELQEKIAARHGITPPTSAKTEGV